MFFVGSGAGLIIIGSVAGMAKQFINDTATTEIYTLSLHDALPILRRRL